MFCMSSQITGHLGGSTAMGVQSERGRHPSALPLSARPWGLALGDQGDHRKDSRRHQTFFRKNKNATVTIQLIYSLATILNEKVNLETCYFGDPQQKLCESREHVTFWKNTYPIWRFLLCGQWKTPFYSQDALRSQKCGHRLRKSATTCPSHTWEIQPHRVNRPNASKSLKSSNFPIL